MYIAPFTLIYFLSACIHLYMYIAKELQLLHNVVALQRYVRTSTYIYIVMSYLSYSDQSAYSTRGKYQFIYPRRSVHVCNVGVWFRFNHSNFEKAMAG